MKGTYVGVVLAANSLAAASGAAADNRNGVAIEPDGDIESGKVDA